MPNLKIKSKKVYSDAGDVWATVHVSVTNRDKYLTSDEHNDVIDYLTSEIMKALASAPYINVPLSRVRVLR